MQRNDDGIEEDDVLISERDSETRDDTCENVKQLSGTIELVVLMDKSEEALIHSLSNHLSSRHELSVKLVEDVLKVVSLDRFFRVEEFKELLHELDRHVNLQLLHVN